MELLQRQFLPCRPGRGCGESTVFVPGAGAAGAVFIYFLEERGKGVSAQLTLPGEGQSGSAGGPRGLALERVGADGSGSAAAAPWERPATVRRGGWTRRAEGASFLSRPQPYPSPGRWLLSAWEWSPVPHRSSGGCR